jgi:hypothetical protein
MDRIAGLITVRLAESPAQPIATAAE